MASRFIHVSGMLPYHFEGVADAKQSIVIGKRAYNIVPATSGTLLVSVKKKSTQPTDSHIR